MKIFDGEGELPCFFVERSSSTVGLRCVDGMDKVEGWKSRLQRGENALLGCETVAFLPS